MANEKRLIDANALLASEWWDSIYDEFDKVRAKLIVHTIPTVDAVEVVRCKECKHMKIDRNGYRWCLVWTGINGMGDDGFCNYGERKDND